MIAHYLVRRYVNSKDSHDILFEKTGQAFFSPVEGNAAFSAAIDFTRTVCYKEGARQAGRFH
jgi:hypothetical protein